MTKDENSLIIYTCITNGKDDLKEYLPEKGVRYICFTDGSVTPKGDQWEVRPLVWKHDDPTKTARFHKCAAHAVLPEHKWSVWMDGHISPKVKQSEIVDWMTKEGKVFGAMVHTERECIYQEMVTLMDLGIEKERTIKFLFERYKSEGFPQKFGLHRTGVLVRKNVDCNTKFNEMWWNEILHNSKRDQLSFDYTRWLMNFYIQELKLDWYKQDLHNDNPKKAKK